LPRHERRGTRFTTDTALRAMTLNGAGIPETSAGEIQMKLNSKVALVTGAAQGLGRSTASALAKEGADVVICDTNEEALAVTAKNISAVRRRCDGVLCDVSSSESVARMFLQIKKRFGALASLVNNAALVRNRPVEEERRTQF
jgi:3-oxoacyl-[acyl-carrier protein] reductase